METAVKSPHVVSCVEPIHEGKSLEGVCYLFQQLCHNFGDILVMWLGRGFAYTDTGYIKKGQKVQDRLYIMWKGEGYMATLSPTVLDALGTQHTHGSMRPVHRRTVIPGLEGLHKLNKVMIHCAGLPDGKQGKLKYSPAAFMARESGSMSELVPVRKVSDHTYLDTTPSPPNGAAVMNRRNDFMGHNRVIHRAAGGGGESAGDGGGKAGAWSAWNSPFSPASITDMRDGSRVEYGSPAQRYPHAVSRTSPNSGSGGTGNELIDMSVIDRIISQRVAAQISAQIAPLQAQNVLQQEQNARQLEHNARQQAQNDAIQVQNVALQREVEELKGGVSKIADKFEQLADPFSSQTFTNNMLDLLMRANAAGRAAAKEPNTVDEGGDLASPHAR